MHSQAALTLDEFIEQCRNGYLTDDQGYGELVGVKSERLYCEVKPSKAAEFLTSWNIGNPGTFRIYWRSFSVRATA